MTAVKDTYRVSIKASPEAVFDAVSDMTRHTEWNDGLTIEAVTPGPVRVGSQYRSWGDGHPQTDPSNNIEVTALERPTRFSFAAKDPQFGTITHEFTFRAEGGGTLVERTTSANWPLPVAILWRIALQPLIAKPRMAKSFAALKAQLERPASG